MKSLIYGGLPDREQFNAAFEAMCPSGFYTVHLNHRDSTTVAFTCPTCNGTGTLAVGKAKLHAFLTGGGA
jgi:hypothetical protein